jgi:hypothetical protein
MLKMDRARLRPNRAARITSSLRVSPINLVVLDLLQLAYRQSAFIPGAGTVGTG